MSSTLKYLILCVLLILVNNASYEIVLLPKEVNDGETRYFELLISEFWIYTKIEKNSQIIVEITTEDNKQITKDQVQYTKYYKDSNTTAFAQIPVFTSLSKNNYKCTYDIDKDRALFKNKKVDIKVGDKFYMTQINDWYINFKDYEGKVVEIEGKYIRIGNYDFIGRSGPTCPYCTGGYVDFEFKTNESLKDIESEQSWLKIIGILRKGKSHMSDGKNQDFYYIETMSLEKMDKAGIDPITD